jgi:putative transposase
MGASINVTPGEVVRWHKRRFVVVDDTGFDAVIAREVGKRRVERIPIRELKLDKHSGSSANPGRVREQHWQTAVKRFAILKPLLEMDSTKRTRAKVERVAKLLRRHPGTIYRWIGAYNDSQRVSAFLRKSRSDRGRSRLPKEVNKIIDTAINNFYLTAKQPRITAVIEEVGLRCFKAKLKTPSANTIRRRIAMLSDRVKLKKRKGKQLARTGPIKGKTSVA